MNLIIDVTRLVRRLIKGKTLTGIDRVSMAYVQHYQHDARALVRWCGHGWVLPRLQSGALFRWMASPDSARTAVFIIAQGMLFNRAPTDTMNTFLLNTGHMSLKPSDYLRMIRRWGVKPIFFVHDLIPIHYPEYCSPGESLRHKKKMDDVLAMAYGVITNSEATRHDLVQYAALTHQIMPPSEVALLAPGFRQKSPSARLFDKPYFVILSTIEPRKNHVLLLQIWRDLVMRQGDRAPHLIVLGQRGWECENALDLLERCPCLNGFVTEIAGCSDADLVTYLYHSQALLIPSFAEGYGLPLVEALVLGVPVIASDLPVFQEIAGNIPEYVDPLDGKRWGALIMEYAQSNSERRAAQRLRMQSFKGPTWENHFIQVDAFLKRSLDETTCKKTPVISSK